MAKLTVSNARVTLVKGQKVVVGDLSALTGTPTADYFDVPFTHYVENCTVTPMSAVGDTRVICRKDDAAADRNNAVEVIGNGAFTAMFMAWVR